MLLSGGFENQVLRLIHMFRLKEKQIASSASSGSTGENVDFRPWTEFEPAETIAVDASDAEDNLDEEDEDEEDESSELGEGEENMKPKDIRKKDWQRSRRLYTRSKQYIFAAATLPDIGRKTPGAVLKKLMPDAKWVNGNFLHRRNPRSMTLILNICKVDLTFNHTSMFPLSSQSEPLSISLLKTL